MGNRFLKGRLKIIHIKNKGGSPLHQLVAGDSFAVNV
jgi:hypothetical protein